MPEQPATLYIAEPGCLCLALDCFREFEFHNFVSTIAHIRSHLLYGNLYSTYHWAGN
jgi:hypothetical protein